jgi:hypothetical protein
MIPYILHVTVITTICFLFYKLLLQKETFYHLNRWILLGCLAVSFGLPLLPVPREFSWREKWAEVTERANTPQLERTNAQPQERTNVQQLASRTNAETKPLQGVSDVPAVTLLPMAPLDEKGKAKAGQKQGHREHERMGHSRKAASSAGPAGQAKDGMTTATPGGELPLVNAGEMQHKNARDNVAGTPSTGTASAGMVSTGTASAPIFSTANFFLVLTWLFYGYLFGVLLFGGSFLMQIAILVYQSYSRPVIHDGRFRIVEVRGNRAPCSFGNTIFINPENYDWETYNQILIHEKIHVNGRHTLDILLAEIAVVFQWFNPFVWWYRREVENNLEFLTDASVLLHRDVERSAYQLSLLRVSAPHLPFSITNNYNQSLLKKRIVMMNSKRSSFHTVWKYFFLLPVLTVLVCALNKPAVLAAPLRSTAPHRSNTSGDAGSTATTTDPLNTRAPLAATMSAIGDTTVKPASGNGNSNDGSRVGDSTRDHHYYNDEDLQILKAYSDGQNGYDLDRLSAKLAAAQNSAIQLQFKDQQLAISDQILQAQKLQLKLLNDNQLHIKVDPSTDMHFDLKPAVIPKINMGTIDFPHMDMMSDTGMREGAWFATSSDDKMRIELRSGDDDHNWNSSFSVDKKEITPYPGQGNVEFKLVREAGTIAFKGQFDGEQGFGHFKFTPDEGYMAAIKQMGVEEVDDRREFAYFTLNIKKEYVNMLVQNGYPHITQRDLISFAAMKIDKDFIQQWRGSGFDDADNPRTLISLKAMKIDRAYADEIKASGYDHVNVHDLISLRAMNVDRAYIRSLGRNKDNTPIPIREVISYKAMHIDSGYVEGLRKVGYTNLSRNDVTSLYAMHVTPEYIKSLQDLGYTDIPTRELTSLKAMNITPEYVKGFRDMGFKDLNARELTSLKAMNITPEYIKGFRDIGYTDLSARELSSLKAMNVTPDFVLAFKKVGFDHIPVHTLTSLKATGVDADYVAKMKAKGFVSDDLNKYIRLKNDFN